MAEISDLHHRLCSGVKVERCPRTGRVFEDGSGALSREQQTANFVREAAIAADMPRDGERCSQTGRFYECGSGALPKSMQTANFIDQLPPERKARRRANAEKLMAAEPAGKA